MVTPGRTLRACVPALAVLFALICAVVGPAVAAAGPAASGSPRPAASGPPGFTGHWAIAGTSGVDLVQRGASVTGTSAMGISLAGNIAGRTVSFRWWRGSSFDRAKKSERGTGTLTLSIGGDELAIAAKDDEAGPGPFPTSFNAVRVHDIIATPTQAPLWPDYWSWTPGQIISVTRAYLDFICDSWIFSMETGYWPSPAVVWIAIEDRYKRTDTLLVGGWLPNGGGPVLLKTRPR